MKIPKLLGGAFAVLAVGTLITAISCNDSGSGDCVGACQHVFACIFDGGTGPFGPTFCADSCNADGGVNQCKNEGAAAECVNGLSCAQIGNADSTEYNNCLAKAECPDAG